SYFSVVGVHTTLWAFTALYLPRSTFLSDITTPGWDQSQLSSRDRPQHPFLEALTRNPTSTLACICAGALLLQGWWAGWLRDLWLEMNLRGTEDEKRVQRAQYQSKKVTAFRDALLLTLAASIAIHITLIVFGAPITSYILKTSLLSLLLAIMTVYPPAFVIGVPFGRTNLSVVKRWTWVRLFVELSTRTPVERALVYPAVGTLVGCWLGIIPIALDWDRPWQAWPLTPTFAAIGGYIISSLLALTINTLTQLAQENIVS
ncbi:GPI biosynthesis protein family Pig-F-domain-containing protein, partial [Panaeolus papilionaceus]